MPTDIEVIKQAIDDFRKIQTIYEVSQKGKCNRNIRRVKKRVFDHQSAFKCFRCKSH